MARIAGNESPGIVGRLAYWFTKRKFGRVVLPVKIHALHPRLLRGLGSMEMAQQAAKTIDAGLKELCGIRVAMRVGCPF
jgi:hypothetical protein